MEGRVTQTKYHAVRLRLLGKVFYVPVAAPWRYPGILLFYLRLWAYRVVRKVKWRLWRRRSEKCEQCRFYRRRYVDMRGVGSLGFRYYGAGVCYRSGWPRYRWGYDTCRRWQGKH